MKCHPLRWLWGLPLLGLWFWVTAVSERVPIETDLAARSQAALEDSGFGWATARYDGRDGVLMGRATDVGSQKAAAKLVRDTWGVRVLRDDTRLADVLKEYVMSVRFDGSDVTLSGFVPDKLTRGQLLKAVRAKFPDATVRDELEYARGDFDIGSWFSGVSFGVDQLAVLETGRLQFVNMGYEISGHAPTYVAYKGVRSAISTDAPKGFKLVRQDVVPPRVSPYTWQAERSSTQLVISGHVPSEEDRARLFGYVKELFPKLAIIDRMETAAGSTKGWFRATSVLADQLARLDTGKARMTDAGLLLEGNAASEDIAARIKTALSDDIPQPYTIKSDIKFPEPKPPVINPFVSSVDVEPKRVRVFGYAPSEDARKAFLADVKVAFPNREVIDNLKIGSGGPQSWRVCLKAGLSGVATLGAGQVRLSDQNIEVSGETADEGIAEKLDGDVRAAANRACASKVNVTLNAPPEPNLNWSIVSDGAGRVTLEGEVPNATTRTALLTRAADVFKGADIIDRMRVVPGYAKKWRGVALAGVGLLGKLRKGSAQLSGQALKIVGEAKDTAVASAVKGQLKSSVVRGYTGSSDITVVSDAMIWAREEAKRKEAAESAAQKARDAEDARQVVLRRKAEEDARKKAAEAARAEETRRQAEDDARRKAEEDARKKAEEEEVRRREQEAADERARSEAAAEARRRAEAAATERVAEAARKRQAKADACSMAMQRVADAGVIQFAFASHELDRKSHATLDEVAGQADRCPGFKIIVSGHTDSVGTTRRNMSLSKRRAQSVVDYLIQAGVPRERLQAVGYGEDRPVAPNSSDTNRAKNRRIEFAVKSF